MKSILQEFKQHLAEQTSNVTVLFPGGFKPITGAGPGVLIIPASAGGGE